MIPGNGLLVGCAQNRTFEIPREPWMDHED
jgi:hypothetical protein